MHYAFEGCIHVHVTPEEGRLGSQPCLEPLWGSREAGLRVNRPSDGSKGGHSESLGTQHLAATRGPRQGGARDQQVPGAPLGSVADAHADLARGR